MVVSGQRNNTEAFARLPASPKTRLPKQDHQELKCVSLVVIFRFHSLVRWVTTDTRAIPVKKRIAVILTLFLLQNFINNGYRAYMLLWKRFTIFPRNLSCQSSYFRWKSVDFILFCGFRVGNKKIAEISAGSLSRHIAFGQAPGEDRKQIFGECETEEFGEQSDRRGNRGSCSLCFWCVYPPLVISL